jgi:hypothetical protein
MKRTGDASPRRSERTGDVLGLAFVALLGPAACSTRPKAVVTREPFLSVFERDGGSGPRGAVAPGAVPLALGGLPPGELRRVREHLAESTDGALRRAAPELFDLDWRPGDDARSDPLRRALPDLPALTAAANLLGSPWEGPGISVRLGPTCEAAASRCVPLFAQAAESPGDSLVRRGRALAWALGNAGRLRASAGSRQALLRALREAQPRPYGTVAMVFDATRGTLDPAELDLLRREALRSMETLAPGAPQRSWIEAIGAARADWQLPIVLDEDELLVIPRLSALARLEDFASEVERAGTFEWIARPGGAGGR